MTETPAQQTETPTEQSAPSAPSMALRTYMMLRLAMIGVIFALAVSLGLQIYESKCVQSSISAYYYTPTKAVLVGALIALGTGMIALWGRNVFEDGFLNLAGLLAPVVALVPTAEATNCSVASEGKTPNAGADAPGAVTDSAHLAIDNNITAFGSVVAASLAVLLLLAIFPNTIVPRPATRPGRKEYKRWLYDPGFWVPYVMALALWSFGYMKFTADNRTWFYENAHSCAAITMFVFIVGVVGTNAFIQWTDRRAPAKGRPKRYTVWFAAYSLVGACMVGVATVIVIVGNTLPDTWFGEHWIFIVEATLISLFAVFWLLQTVERRNDGAGR